MYEPSTTAAEIAAFFTRARAEADAWQKSRHEYMAARFAEGKHPDTDADFWAGFKASPPPRPPGAMLGSARTDQIVLQAAPFATGGVLTVAVLVAVRRRMRRRRAARAAAQAA